MVNHSSKILPARSFRICWPRSGVATGLAIHLRMAGGTQAGSLGSGQSTGSLALNLWSLPFDSSSASVAPVPSHLVILSMETDAPMAAATRPMAATRVVQSGHVELYPFRHIATDPELSTHMRTGLLRQRDVALEMQMSGPTSSSADNFLLSCRPSTVRIPLLIFRPHGTMNQKFGPMPPVPCPTDSDEPPAASVKNSVAHGTLRMKGGGMDASPSVVLSMMSQK